MAGWFELVADGRCRPYRPLTLVRASTPDRPSIAGAWQGPASGFAVGLRA